MITPEIYQRLKSEKKIGYNVTTYQILSEIGEYSYKGKLIKYRISDSIKFIIKEYYQPLGLYKRNPHPDSKIEDFGVVINNKWHRINTLETNQSGQLFLFSQCNIILESLRNSGQTFVIIYNKKISTERIIIGENWKENIDLIYDKIHNLLLIVRKYGLKLLDHNSIIFKEMISICADVMLVGDIGEMLFGRYIDEFFEDYLEIKKSSGLGDPLDIQTGIDFWIRYPNNKEITIQVKYGHYYNNNEQIFTKSKFSKYSNCDFWVLVYKGDIIMIKNDRNKNKRLQDTTWIFNPDVIVKKIKIIDMFEELKNLMKVASKNNISVVLTKEGDSNKIFYNEETKTLSIHFPQPEDLNIKKMITEETDRLNNLFN